MTLVNLWWIFFCKYQAAAYALLQIYSLHDALINISKDSPYVMTSRWYVDHSLSEH